MRKAAFAFACALLVGGVALISWPALNALLYGMSVAPLKEDFLRDTREVASEGALAEGAPGADAHLRDLEGLYEHLRTENERLFESGQANLVDAFSYEQPAVDLSTWGLVENRIGFISIPAVGAELPLYLGANNAQMARGAVHLTQTSYPIGGENTNCVIAAHRGTWDGLPMFRDLGEVLVGDAVVIENFRERLEYRVCEIVVIQPNEMDRVLIQEGRDLVTLVTCTPLGSNWERLVVYCERVGSV